MITYLVLRHRTAALVALTLFIILGVDVQAALAVSVTDVVEAFKYTYGAAEVAYLASEEVVAWNFLPKRQAEGLGGRGAFIIPFRTVNAGVFQGHAEGGAKTTRRAQPDTVEAVFGLQEFHGVVDASWKMLHDMTKSQNAFERGLDFIEKAQRTRVFRLLNAEINGTGRGELAVLPAQDDGTTITVNALPFLEKGMIVDLMDDSDDNALLLDGVTVTSVDIANRTVTFGSAPTGSAAGDYFTVADTVTSSASLHVAGLGAWISTSNPKSCVGNLGGINRSTAGNEFWQATVLTNSGNGNRPFTEDLGITLLDTIRERGGKNPDAWMSNLKIIRRYHGDLREDVFYAMSNISEFQGKVGTGRDEKAMQVGKDGKGKTPYKFSGIDWHAEPYMQPNRIWGLSTEHVFIGHGDTELPAPLSEVFSGLVEFFTSTANTTFEIVSYWQGEVVCDNPMALGAITELSEA